MSLKWNSSSSNINVMNFVKYVFFPIGPTQFYLFYFSVSAARAGDIIIFPADVLMWMTSSTTVLAVGFHKMIDVEFGSTTHVNTCALVVTFRAQEFDEPVNHYSELLVNSQTFGQN